MVLRQAAQDRSAVGNVDMMRAIVTDQHKALVEVNGMELSKAAPAVQAIHDQHGNAGLQVGLTAHGKTRSTEQRITHDQIADQFA